MHMCKSRKAAMKLGPIDLTTDRHQHIHHRLHVSVGLMLGGPGKEGKLADIVGAEGCGWCIFPVHQELVGPPESSKSLAGFGLASQVQFFEVSMSA